MLRITIHHAANDLVMQLEGCVVGPWVGELDACWRRETSSLRGRLRVDLRAVWRVDTAGRILMARMHDAGASFMTSGCVMPEVIREVTGRCAAAATAAERS